MRYTLGKHEILRGSAFQEVFEHGKKIDGTILRCFALLKKEPPKNIHQRTQVGFAVRSSIVRRAVDRNRVRRLMREAYRLNKYVLTNLHYDDHQAHIVFLFSPSEQEFVIPTFKEIDEDMKLLLNKIVSMLK